MKPWLLVTLLWLVTLALVFWMGTCKGSRDTSGGADSVSQQAPVVVQPDAFRARYDSLRGVLVEREHLLDAAQKKSLAWQAHTARLSRLVASMEDTLANFRSAVAVLDTVAYPENIIRDYPLTVPQPPDTIHAEYDIGLDTWPVLEIRAAPRLPDTVVVTVKVPKPYPVTEYKTDTWELVGVSVATAILTAVVVGKTR